MAVEQGRITTSDLRLHLQKKPANPDPSGMIVENESECILKGDRICTKIAHDQGNCSAQDRFHTLESIFLTDASPVGKDATLI